MHQLTGAYIFVSKDYNTLTDERLIQLSGNDKSVDFCKKEIKFIVNQIAPHLDIDLVSFKRKKRQIKSNYEKLLQEQMALKERGESYQPYAEGTSLEELLFINVSTNVADQDEKDNGGIFASSPSPTTSTVFGANSQQTLQRNYLEE